MLSRRSEPTMNLAAVGVIALLAALAWPLQATTPATQPWTTAAAPDPSPPSPAPAMAFIPPYANENSRMMGVAFNVATGEYGMRVEQNVFSNDTTINSQDCRGRALQFNVTAICNPFSSQDGSYTSTTRTTDAFRSQSIKAEAKGSFAGLSASGSYSSSGHAEHMLTRNRVMHTAKAAHHIMTLERDTLPETARLSSGFHTLVTRCLNVVSKEDEVCQARSRLKAELLNMTNTTPVPMDQDYYFDVCEEHLAALDCAASIANLCPFGVITSMDLGGTATAQVVSDWTRLKDMRASDRSWGVAAAYESFVSVSASGTDVEKDAKEVADQHIVHGAFSVGGLGPPESPEGMAAWRQGVEDYPGITAVKVTPCASYVAPALFEHSEDIVLRFAGYLRNATEKLLAINCHAGCTDTSHPDFMPSATVDGPCRSTAPTSNFGGLFQQLHKTSANTDAWEQQCQHYRQGDAKSCSPDTIPVSLGKITISTSYQHCTKSNSGSACAQEGDKDGKCHCHTLQEPCVVEPFVCLANATNTTSPTHRTPKLFRGYYACQGQHPPQPNPLTQECSCGEDEDTVVAGFLHICTRVQDKGSSDEAVPVLPFGGLLPCAAGVCRHGTDQYFAGQQPGTTCPWFVCTKLEAANATTAIDHRVWQPLNEGHWRQKLWWFCPAYNASIYVSPAIDKSYQQQCRDAFGLAPPVWTTPATTPSTPSESVASTDSHASVLPVVWGVVGGLALLVVGLVSYRFFPRQRHVLQDVPAVEGAALLAEQGTEHGHPAIPREAQINVAPV